MKIHEVDLIAKVLNTTTAVENNYRAEAKRVSEERDSTVCNVRTKAVSEIRGILDETIKNEGGVMLTKPKVHGHSEG